MSIVPTVAGPTAGAKNTKLSALEAKRQMESLGVWVNAEYQKCKNARSAIERQWYLNMAFYYGNQYVTPLGGSGVSSGAPGKLITPAVPPWRTRLIVNRIRPMIRTELARTTSQKPTASVVPASSEDEDLFAAQAAEQIWESGYNSKKVHREFTRAMWWTLITGTGYLKCYWDQSVVDKETGDVGDICISPVTPFHVFVPDLRECEIENQLYVINAYTRPVDVIKRQYATELADVELKASVVSTNEVMDDAYLNLKAGGSKPDSVLVMEMWMKAGAHPDFPDGGLITVVDTHVVEMITDGIPYALGEYPFIKFDHVPTGKFYAESVIVDLISLQREYNRTRSQIIEAKNRMAKPQLIAPKGSVDPSKITTEPGIVIEYRPGLDPPRPMPLQPLPAYVIQELERCIGDMEDISSQHAISKGAAPSGVTAATAISYLQERDDSLLTHTYDSVEQGMEKLARQYLGHVVQYWDLPRTVKVVGDDGAFDTMVLKGSDIKSGTDIRMEAGTALPQSKAAKQALIMDMMTRQFITPDQGLRIMEIGGVQKLYDQLQVDERASQRENLKMKMTDPNAILSWENQKNQADAMAAQQAGAVGVPQGLLPPTADPALASLLGPNSQAPDPNAPQMDPSTPQPNPIGNLSSPGVVDPQTGMPTPSAQMPLLVPTNTWDNHAVHIEIHNRFRKGQTFDKLGPEVKTLFESHIKQHQDALNASSMAAAGASMGPGGPPPGGAPAPSGAGGGSNQFTGLPPQGAQNG